MLGIFKVIALWFCNHPRDQIEFVRNIGGDEQMHHYVKDGGLARSEWECNKCESKIYLPERRD